MTEYNLRFKHTHVVTSHSVYPRRLHETHIASYSVLYPGKPVVLCKARSRLYMVSALYCKLQTYKTQVCVNNINTFFGFYYILEYGRLYPRIRGCILEFLEFVAVS